MEATPFVSVIIPTYHDWDRLKLCLNALAQQSYLMDRFEVIVVNNDPDDRPSYVVASGNVRLLEEAKPGSYAARNAAIRVAKGEVFAFTDSDCIPDRGWLKHGVSAIQSGAERVGGAVALFFDGPDLNNFPTAFQRCTAFRQKRNVANGWAVTANMIARRRCFEVAGLFDGETLSGGDLEWGKRAATKNYRIEFCNKTIVNHPIRSNWPELFLKQRRIIGGKIRLNSKKWSQLMLFGMKQLFPPVITWKRITDDNADQMLSVKIKAILAAWVIKYYGIFVITKLILNLEKESRA